MPAPYALSPADSRGRYHREPESPTRSPFQRDRDRIIHSGAFRKLEYKTQVFVYHVGDYYRTRLTHSLEVAQIARSVSRCLALDEDLAEAIALAHDLGHPPFGHAGEEALAAAMAPYGGFDHNDQTVRVLTRLEQRYADFDGLNLTWETLEGVVKHNGPLVGEAQAGGARDPGKVPPTIAAVDAAWPLALAEQPSLEAQVAAVADDIAYNNHDIDDGLRAGLFTIDDIRSVPVVGEILRAVETDYPGLHRRRLIHETVRRLIDRMVNDLLAETRRRLTEAGIDGAAAVRRADGAMVGFSSDMATAQAGIRSFLFTRMYRHFQVNRETSKARRIVQGLFELFMAEPAVLPAEWQDRAVTDSLPERARTVADYIAGMTDRYALLEYRRLLVLGAEM